MQNLQNEINTFLMNYTDQKQFQVKNSLETIKHIYNKCDHKELFKEKLIIVISICNQSESNKKCTKNFHPYQ